MGGRGEGRRGGGKGKGNGGMGREGRLDPPRIFDKFTPMPMLIAKLPPQSKLNSPQTPNKQKHDELSI